MPCCVASERFLSGRAPDALCLGAVITMVNVTAAVFLSVAAAAILWHRARRNRKVAKSSVRKHDSEEADIDKVRPSTIIW